MNEIKDVELPDLEIPGIVLAAGASTRMGRPKALLAFPDGSTLLERQCALLLEGGCSQVIAVVGARAAEIQQAHPALPARWAINEGWERGQFSSLQVGLAAALESDPEGALVLPIDALTGTPAIPEALITVAGHNPHIDAIIPDLDGRGGHPVYLSRSAIARLLALPPEGKSSRLDFQISQLGQVLRLPVSDPGIIENINTIEEWDRFSAEGRR